MTKRYGTHRPLAERGNRTLFAARAYLLARLFLLYYLGKCESLGLEICQGNDISAQNSSNCEDKNCVKRHMTNTMDSQAFENTSTSVAASQMRNALNNLTDSCSDAQEKKVSLHTQEHCIGQD